MQEVTKEIIAAVSQGKSDAFQTLYYAFADPMFRYLRRKTGNADIAEDLVQELFTKVWKNRGNLDPERPIKAYLYQAATNLAVDHLRKKVQEGFSEEPKPEDHSEEPDHLAFEKRDKIRRAVASLPDSQRKVFCLSRYDGLKYHEIADVLQISPKTVETHMGKALKKLREILSELMAYSFFLLFFL